MDEATLWPPKSAAEKAELAELAKLLQPTFPGQLSVIQLPLELSNELERLYLPLAFWLNQQRRPGEPLLVGVNGSQGSGKSALCNLLKWILESAFDCRTESISIDDLYLTKSQREKLATDVHPLLATRGVPGTHDIPLGLDLLQKLKTTDADETISIPRFNKAIDDRLPEHDWDLVTPPIDLIFLEGWCVGATPQEDDELAQPINPLEEKEDPQGTWRKYVNKQLQGPYKELFSQLDLLLMLRVPAWEMVFHWRKRQEEQLAARRSGSGVMGDVALRRFIQHYERLTRHQLAHLPEYADLVMELNSNQRVIDLSFKR